MAALRLGLLLLWVPIVVVVLCVQMLVWMDVRVGDQQGCEPRLSGDPLCVGMDNGYAWC